MFSFDTSWYNFSLGQEEQAGKRRWRRADTNVVSIKFDKLTAPSNMHTGDPVHCKECQGVLSCISKLTPKGDEQVRGVQLST